MTQNGKQQVENSVLQGMYIYIIYYRLFEEVKRVKYTLLLM